jgi:hypothetical protein
MLDHPSSNSPQRAYILCESMRNKPCNRLSHDLGLIIDTLDRDEDFPERLRVHNIQLPFSSKSRAVLNKLRRQAIVGRKSGEQEDHAERVVDIS